jgi:hypothetical protein
MTESVESQRQNSRKAARIHAYTEGLLGFRDNQYKTLSQPDIAQETANELASYMWESLPPGVDVVDLGEGLQVKRPDLGGTRKTNLGH